MKAVFSWSSKAKGICWYPWKASRKLIRGWLTVASTNWSIRGVGKGSLWQSLLKSVKSTHTRHFSLFFFTTTVLANHSELKTFLIAPACLSLFTSFLTASECSLDEHRDDCFLGRTAGLTFKLWQMKFGSTLGALLGLHANTSIFFLRNSTRSSFSWGGS